MSSSLVSNLTFTICWTHLNSPVSHLLRLYVVQPLLSISVEYAFCLLPFFLLSLSSSFLFFLSQPIFFYFFSSLLLHMILISIDGLSNLRMLPLLLSPPLQQIAISMGFFHTFSYPYNALVLIFNLEVVAYHFCQILSFMTAGLTS